MNICAKYNDMHAMASRTLIINPTSKQKATYQIAYDAQCYLISLLKIGTPLNEIFEKTKKFIVDKDQTLADKIHTNFGFGIGCNFKEELLIINA
jgi:nucleosome binding factor SPN SPT16 subunit